MVIQATVLTLEDKMMINYSDDVNYLELEFATGYFGNELEREYDAIELMSDFYFDFAGRATRERDQKRVNLNCKAKILNDDDVRDYYDIYINSQSNSHLRNEVIGVDFTILDGMVDKIPVKNDNDEYQAEIYFERIYVKVSDLDKIAEEFGITPNKSYLEPKLYDDEDTEKSSQNSQHKNSEHNAIDRADYLGATLALMITKPELFFPGAKSGISAKAIAEIVNINSGFLWPFKYSKQINMLKMPVEVESIRKEISTHLKRIDTRNIANFMDRSGQIYRRPTTNTNKK